MDAALLIARLVLAGVFAVAGVAKLSDLEGSRKAIIDFGVPARLCRPPRRCCSTVSWGWPPPSSPPQRLVGRPGGAGAAAVVRGWHFGQPGPRPQARVPLLRTAALLPGRMEDPGPQRGPRQPSRASSCGQATRAAMPDPALSPGSGRFRRPSFWALLGGVLVLSLLAGQWWFLLHLLRQNGRLLVRLEALEASLATGGAVAPSQNGSPVHQGAEGLPVGSEAPNFSLSGLDGETLTLDALRSSGKTVMVLFTDPGLRPLQRDAAGCRSLARGARPQAHPLAHKSGRGGGEQDQGSRARS